MVKRMVVTCVALALATGLTCSAEEAPTTQPQVGLAAGQIPPRGKLSVQLAHVTTLLQSNDDAQVEQGVGEAIYILNTRGNVGTFETPGKSRYIDREAPTWRKLLLKQKRTNLAEELAINAITGIFAHDLGAIEQWQEFRVRAKLAASKPQEALSLAKSYYNVCAMPHTNQAIDLICSCLYEINKGSDPIGPVRSFKLEQIQGATPPTTTQPSSLTVERSRTLAGITIDSQFYKDGIDEAEYDGDAFRGQMAKGNLLLLADQPKEAKEAFDKAYSLASDKTMAIATEAIARAMRAEDGSVGRANQYILSLRPQDPTQ